MSTIYIDSNSEFYNTLRLYRNYIGYKNPYTYGQWKRLPDKFKAAALYVQFYNEITLAWYKVKTQWSIEEEGVETVNQYLVKNVEKIEKDKKRFTPQYIYTVAYNCLYCLCIDASKNKERYYNEVPSQFSSQYDDSVDWFDIIGEVEDADEIRLKEELRDFFDSLDEETQVCIHFILGECSESKICSKLKELGKISGNTRDKEYKQKVIKAMEIYAPYKIRVEISKYCKA